jgi:tetrahydromethanopterin S-methyltransferase subunit B
MESRCTQELKSRPHAELTLEMKESSPTINNAIVDRLVAELSKLEEKMQKLMTKEEDIASELDKGV